MDNILTIKERILTFLKELNIKKVDFFNTTGIQSSNFKGKNMSSQPGGDMIVKILTLYPDISADWLLTGRGSMLRTPPASVPEAVRTDDHVKGIPLVTEQAAAGFGNADFCIADADVKDYYVVPKFKYCHVDFMIEISGSSMYPKYNSGDVVACSVIHESRFIQWNKCHIIATREQGILCKRLRQSSQPDAITAVSDNKEYPPFDIPKDEITGIALVVGVIRLE